MSKRFAWSVVVLASVLSLLGGLAAELVASKAALASRNNSGVMSLAAGNPVSTGTTITSSWANGTLSDIASEITNSLDRNGRGAMAAALQLFDGTVSSPGLTWGTETNSGLYRNGSKDFRLSLGGTDVVKFSGATNTVALTATGNGNEKGGFFVGGATGDGLAAQGGGANAKGLSGVGSGTGVGGKFSNGTAATGGTRQDAIQAFNGDLNMDGVANATSTTAVKNRLTPTNIVKVWGLLSTNGSGACSVSDGFNITSCSVAAGGEITITFAQAFANTNYTAYGSPSATGPRLFYIHTANTGSMGIQVWTLGGAELDCSTNACTVSFMAMGKQ